MNPRPESVTKYGTHHNHDPSHLQVYQLQSAADKTAWKYREKTIPSQRERFDVSHHQVLHACHEAGENREDIKTTLNTLVLWPYSVNLNSLFAPVNLQLMDDIQAQTISNKELVSPRFIYSLFLKITASQLLDLIKNKFSREERLKIRKE
jgi:hypothetical protein